MIAPVVGGYRPIVGEIAGAGNVFAACGLAFAWGQANVAWLSRLRPNIWDAVALPIVLGVRAMVSG